MSCILVTIPGSPNGFPVSAEEDQLIQELIVQSLEENPGARFLARRVKNEYGELESKRHANNPDPPHNEPPKLAIAA